MDKPEVFKDELVVNQQMGEETQINNAFIFLAQNDAGVHRCKQLVVIHQGLDLLFYVTGDNGLL